MSEDGGMGEVWELIAKLQHFVAHFTGREVLDPGELMDAQAACKQLQRLIPRIVDQNLRRQIESTADSLQRLIDDAEFDLGL